MHPDRCASLFKRHMGSEWAIRLAGDAYTPEKLSSLVLQSTRHDAEAHLGHPVTDAVITVPAYFNEHQRKSTIHAGLIAVLEVEATIVETKKKVSHLVTEHARGLSQSQIAAAVAEMQSIKHSPREEMANR